MKFSIKNLGAIHDAELDLANFTVICGKNNSGKTYVTYAIYGFLKLWKNYIELPISDILVKNILDNGIGELDLNDYEKSFKITLNHASKSYTSIIHRILASKEEYFSSTKFSIHFDFPSEVYYSTYKQKISARKTNLLIIEKEENSSIVKITLGVENEKPSLTTNFLTEILSQEITSLLFESIIPTPFIASAERTGSAIFTKELFFARNRMLDQINETRGDIDPFKLLSKIYSDYALPVKENVEFTQRLTKIRNEKSWLAINHPDILKFFDQIAGGNYKATSDEVFFSPKKSGTLKLTMDESSSAVRSLVDIGFFLRHQANKGDILIIDEPELNLHPENQRMMARLCAKLANVGIKIFVTTHSDYFVKEINTLIMLKGTKDKSDELCKRYGYDIGELLDHNTLSVYLAHPEKKYIDGLNSKKMVNTLSLCDIDQEEGAQVKSFDESIEIMNTIQQEILFG
ncbi:AAA family ATPase [Ruficoccus amylovorans]|uniref:AAA family ATPase n=1 Tax=Ruficoccus amylovorans TaxID=1804625 RepID=A0A842HAT7_9BACT|nr:AAA family ATPase [Ruficoccus amylovorans]MBC2592836.1 AAA family ATPase [Ruficoccus amylovorans]